MEAKEECKDQLERRDGAVPYGDFSDDVVKTRDFTPLEPDVEEFKYYAPDVGVILEKNPETGERVDLVSKTTP